MKLFKHATAYPTVYGAALLESGFAVQENGIASHDIIRRAGLILAGIEEKQAAEWPANNGAALHTVLFHQLFADFFSQSAIQLPQPGEYAAAMWYLPCDLATRQALEKEITETVEEQQFRILGWREVPTDEQAAVRSNSPPPYIKQMFIVPADSSKQLKLDEGLGEQALFRLRRKLEQLVAAHSLPSGSLAGLSAKLIAYHAPLSATDFFEFYKDLRNPVAAAPLAVVYTYRYGEEKFGWTLPFCLHYMFRSGKLHSIESNRDMLQCRVQQFRAPYVQGLKDPLELDALECQLDKREDYYGSVLADRLAEQFYLSDRSIAQSALQMMPNLALSASPLNKTLQAYYQFNSTQMEPWEGPAVLIFTDGTHVGAMIDRNSFRSVRYIRTSDGCVLLSSRPANFDVQEKHISIKNRLRPGRMLYIDMAQQETVSDAELKDRLAAMHPYEKWVGEQLITLSELPESPLGGSWETNELVELQIRFGYTSEDVHKMVEQMAVTGQDPILSMGFDAPIALLSMQYKQQRLYNYFKQDFQQLLSPSIDPVREQASTATQLTLGPERDLLSAEAVSCRRIYLETPILLNQELTKLRRLRRPGLRAMTLPIHYEVSKGADAIVAELETLGKAAVRLAERGYSLIVLSDRDTTAEQAAIPALLATAAVHQALVQAGMRNRLSLLVESGEPRETHHFALLIGYGADAVNPYLALETIEDLIDRNILKGISEEKAVRNFVQAATRGTVKVMSRAGIATVQAYRGSRMFQIIGLEEEWCRQYFGNTKVVLGGLSLQELAQDTAGAHHQSLAVSVQDGADYELESGGQYQWRKDGEEHLFHPQTIHTLQTAAKKNNYQTYLKFTDLVQGDRKRHLTLRSLLEFSYERSEQIALNDVESVESIVKRFRTGAMSYGAISEEAWRSLAVAMNRLGGKANSGEGGLIESDSEEGSELNKIKQIASGRFGVNLAYLQKAEEIQIKIAQGAKPGEGGRLPAVKVYPWIAEIRGTTPGIGLVSPPSHHDIYSVKDLEGFIADIRLLNNKAKVSVKLAAGTFDAEAAIEAAKSGADGILVSGYDGGTAAAPIGSLRHAGLPWEIGLANVHQALSRVNLRKQIRLETDGKLMTGRDVAIAALLGADEYGFSTAPLIVLGCIMMRVCQLDTCPVGIATQNPELRKKFAGDPEHIVNYMTFIAQELREIMAKLGFKTLDEMIGRTDKLQLAATNERMQPAALQLKQLLDLHRKLKAEAMAHDGGTQTSPVITNGAAVAALQRPEIAEEAALFSIKVALEQGKRFSESFELTQNMRAAGAAVSSLVGQFLSSGSSLPDDFICITYNGRAGDSFGTFAPRGVTLSLIGDSNDFFGRGLSGGRIAISPAREATYEARYQIITGNSALYGATSGEAFINGVAGARFAVRNSGATAVAEGAGDHACEYMTGGLVIILGETGRNFGAGMTGGTAFILDEQDDFYYRCNLKTVKLERVEQDEDIDILHSWLEKHVLLTGSPLAAKVLQNWETSYEWFVKVTPKRSRRQTD